MAEKRAFLETFNSLSPQMKGALIGGLVGAGGAALFGKRKNMLQNMLMFGGLGAAGGYGLGHLYKSMLPTIPGMGGLAKGINNTAGAASKVLPAAAAAVPAAVTGNMGPAVGTARNVMGYGADAMRGLTRGVQGMISGSTPQAVFDATGRNFKPLGRLISYGKINNAIDTATNAATGAYNKGPAGRAAASAQSASPAHQPIQSFSNAANPDMARQSFAAPGYLQ